MDLFHVTRKGYLDSIQESGLLVNFAQGGMRGIWLVERCRLEWAVLHVAKHQGENVAAMIALPISIPTPFLTYRGRHVWLCREDIPTNMIGSPIDHEQIITSAF